LTSPYRLHWEGGELVTEELRTNGETAELFRGDIGVPSSPYIITHPESKALLVELLSRLKALVPSKTPCLEIELTPPFGSAWLLEIGNLEESAMEEQVLWELEQRIDGDINDHIHAWQPIDSELVYAVAIHPRLVQFWIDLAEEISFNLKAITIKSGLIDEQSERQLDFSTLYRAWKGEPMESAAGGGSPVESEIAVAETAYEEIAESPESQLEAPPIREAGTEISKAIVSPGLPEEEPPSPDKPITEVEVLVPEEAAETLETFSEAEIPEPKSQPESTQLKEQTPAVEKIEPVDHSFPDYEIGQKDRNTRRYAIIGAVSVLLAVLVVGYLSRHRIGQLFLGSAETQEQIEETQPITQVESPAIPPVMSVLARLYQQADRIETPILGLILYGDRIRCELGGGREQAEKWAGQVAALPGVRQLAVLDPMPLASGTLISLQIQESTPQQLTESQFIEKVEELGLTVPEDKLYHLTRAELDRLLDALAASNQRLYRFSIHTDRAGDYIVMAMP